MKSAISNTQKKNENYFVAHKNSIRRKENVINIHNANRNWEHVITKRNREHRSFFGKLIVFADICNTNHLLIRDNVRLSSVIMDKVISSMNWHSMRLFFFLFRSLHITWISVIRFFFAFFCLDTISVVLSFLSLLSSS